MDRYWEIIFETDKNYQILNSINKETIDNEIDWTHVKEYGYDTLGVQKYICDIKHRDFQEGNTYHFIKVSAEKFYLKNKLNEFLQE